MLPGSMFLCPGPVPRLLGWAYVEQLGLSSTACGLMLGNSIRLCTDGVSLQLSGTSRQLKLQTLTETKSYRTVSAEMEVKGWFDVFMLCAALVIFFFFFFNFSGVGSVANYQRTCFILFLLSF